MRGQKQVIEALFSRAGVRINGTNPWDIQVNDDSLYPRLLRDKNLGLGETYMEGLWSCPRIDEFIYRILTADIHREIKESVGMFLPYLSALLFNQQSRRRSHRVAEKHYDLGNDLFMSFLDPYNQYSCAFFNGTVDLAEAQIKKLDLICRKIGLRREDQVLDIGCGWGGLSRYIAERYGCNVTAANISQEQIRYATESCKGLPVRILNRDYRDLEGAFDKIVSVGMFEHVGVKNYRTFMQVVHRVLKENGVFLLQTIGGNLSRIKTDPWVAKYIFPNGMLPSISQIGRAAEELLVMEDWHNLGPHYDKTLLAWHENFQQAWPRLKDRYSERFKRMWEYYLLCFAGSFRARYIQLWQIVFTRGGTPQPPCRC
ncbi:MAG: cyclopropane fatty acyl phospholipid synthase [Deltaproteobacteria bacterium]|nr:cyclopropane fatty acyl phospholipid synthase [Deltaproteobacteria bacterium]